MELLAQAAPRTLQVFVFAFGAVVGSFLNVVIARLPAGESIVSPPSRCPRCRRPIAWYDNVPIASWLLLRARCRGCRLPISARYPVVEALTGLLALAVAWRLGPTFAALGFFAFAAMLVALSAIDLDHFWLPEQITLPLLALGLLSPLWNRALGATLAAYGILPGRPLAQAFAASLSGAAAGALLLWLVGRLGSWLFRKEAMGLGDVWLLAGIGAWLGVQSLFFVVMFSSLQGSAVGLAMVLRRRSPPAGASPSPPAEADAKVLSDEWKPDPHHIPFGPFLALAALEQLLLGDAIWGGWMGMMSRLWVLLDRLGGRLP